MTTTQTEIVLRHIRGLAAAQSGALSDAQLLERFAARREESAFAALVKRHGPMVLAVCRRVLHNAADADDAFQATFLTLAQGASRARRCTSLGGWLHGVAYHMALKVREQVARRRRHESRVAAADPGDPLAEVTGRELLAILDEEVHGLAEKYRTPLVLCYLESKTRDEAARALGWSLRTLDRRLVEARRRLRDRLARRGLALPAALLATALGGAVVPSALAAATLGAARSSSGHSAAVSAFASLLAQPLRTLAAGPRTAIGALLLAASLVVAIAGWFAFRPPAAEGGDPPAASKTPPAADQRPAAPVRKDDKEMLVTGRVLGADGKPVPGAAVVVVGMPLRRYRNDRFASHSAVLAEGKADSEGRFRLAAPRTSSARFQEVYVLAAAEKFALTWRRLNPDAEQPDAVVTLRPEQVIRGSLVDLQGQPAAGVKVTPAYVGGMTNGQPDGVSLSALPRRAAPWPEVVTTDDKGRFEIHGCNRDQGVTLLVNDDRFATQSFRAETPGKPRPEHRSLGYDVGGYLNIQKSEADEKGQPEVLKLSLAPARVIEGRVVYADTGKPAAKALVSGTATDEEGRFLLRFAGREAVTLEIYAPEGSPYFSIFQRVQWAKGAVKQEVKIELPRGILVRGKVSESASGQPVSGAAVQFWPQQVDDPQRPKNVLTGWHYAEVTKEDGTFSMVVLPGPGHLLFQGPTPDFIHQEIGSEVIRTGRPGGSRTYPDAFVKLDLAPKAEPKELAVTLRRGVTVRGQLLGPDGKPVARALMMHRLHVSIGLGWQFPEEVRDGVFEVHGLDPEKTVAVHFLDADKQCGATVELSGKQAGETVTVKLAPCGKATARYLDGKGRPQESYAPAPDIVITPGVAGDFAAVVKKGELLADTASLTNIDRYNYWDRLKTDAKGRVTFPALIPGATYRLQRWEKDHWLPHKEFTAEAGKTIDLGDVVIDRAD
jgi:RNA polymerase sigma factor (sigma-70 family)